MFERIFIPLDGSARSEEILRTLRPILRRRDSEVILFHAIEPPHSVTGRFREALTVLRQTGEAYLDAVNDRLVQEGIRSRRVLRDGPAAKTLLEAARKEEASLIAMRTHGRSGMPRRTLGSVAEEVMRSSDIPVLLLRAFHQSPSGPIRESPQPEADFKKILVPVDGSPGSLSVLRSVEEIARLFEAQVFVVNVLDSDLTYSPAATQVRVAYERLREAGVAVEPVLKRGEPAAQILQSLCDVGADLVAMTTHGRSGVNRMLWGSVTELVLRDCDVPVLVLRAPQEGA